MAESPELRETWTTRELPILVAAYRHAEADEHSSVGEQLRQLEEIRQELGMSVRDYERGLEALINADPPYIEVHTGGGWSGEKAGAGYVEAVTERARRELGTWPNPESVLAELVAALGKAADEASEPEEKTRLRSTAEALSGFARDVAVAVVAKYVPG